MSTESLSPDTPGNDTGPSTDDNGTDGHERRRTRPARRRGALTPQERSLRARLASHASWAQTADPSARTAPARASFLDRFERQVDPDGILDPAERARRAKHARTAYMSSLALKSAKARRAKRHGNGKAGRHGKDSTA